MAKTTTKTRTDADLHHRAIEAAREVARPGKILDRRQSLLRELERLEERAKDVRRAIADIDLIMMD